MVGSQVWLGPNHDPELLVVDLAVAVLVDGLDHLVDLLVGDLAGKVGEHKLELVSSDAACVGRVTRVGGWVVTLVLLPTGLVLAEDPEDLLEVVLLVTVVDLLVHHEAELGEL